MTLPRLALDRLLDWFLPDHSREDREAVRRGRILVGTALSLVLLVIVGVVSRRAMAHLEIGALAACLTSVALFGATLGLYRATGALRLSGLLTLLGLYLLVVGPGWFAAGLNTPALMIAPLIPVAATFLLGPRAGYSSLVVLLPTLGVFILLHHQGHFQDSPFSLDPVTSQIRGVILALVVFLAALFAEISERQRLRAVDRLLRSETLYRRLFEQSRNIVALSTPEGRLIDINQAGVDFFGAASRDELLKGNASSSYVDPQQRRRLLERLELDGFVRDYPSTHHTAEGLRFLEGTTSTIRRDDGTVEFLLAILTDITEKRHAAEERETMLTELAAKNAELERFTAAVSHDLKGPLTTIRGYAGLILHSTRQGHLEQIAGFAEALHEGSGRMAQMIDDLLRLSRMGSRAVERQTLNAAAVATEALASLDGRINASGAEVTIEENLPAVTGDRTLLRIIFQNLIENAVKFTANLVQPRVHIGHRPPPPGENSEITLTVTDNGIGIAPEDHERIFALFERLNKQGEEGTGIGLASVQQAVELQGGLIWVESEGEGNGSTFCFTLPTRKVEETISQE